MGDLTKNFSRSEFACKGAVCCDHSSPVSRRLVRGLQALRVVVGAPLTITSGFRCRKHNKSVGGAADSQHTHGTAADIAAPAGWTPADLARAADALELFDGLGVYPDRGFVHVDVRGARSTWGYIAGKYTTFEEGLSYAGK